MAKSDAAFEAWMQKVDIACQKKCGLSIHDLTDQPFRDLFNDGVRPSTVVNQALREEGF